MTPSEIIRQLPAFRNLSPGQLERVAGLTTHKLLPRQRVLFRQGDVSTGFYAVARGAISLGREQADGTEHVLRIVSCGIAMDCTKHALAAELGMQPETLSRHLTRLSAEGILIVKGRKVIVPVIATLRRIVGGD